LTPIEVCLRQVQDGDLPVFWDQLTDHELQHMAAVTRDYHYDRAAFDRHWQRVRSSGAITLRTVLADGEVAGYIAVFGAAPDREVTYVIGRSYWGRGIATAAIAEMVELEKSRPLHAVVATDNMGSIRVLEKCGFTVTHSSRGFARARGHEIDLMHLILN
jgi:RimJ/RimL family protein N-acetyltransferase